jgi:hypothetical protein
MNFIKVLECPYCGKRLMETWQQCCSEVHATEVIVFIDENGEEIEADD